MLTSPRQYLPFFVLCLLLAVACGDGDAPAQVRDTPAQASSGPAPGDGGIQVQEPRAHVMAGMPHGSVYLTIVNDSDTADRLVSVETTGAAAAETHETVDDEGVLRMVAHPEGFEVPPRGTVELAPQGKHIMLREPQVEEGGTLSLTLHFENAGAVEVEVPVEAMASHGEGH